MTLPLIHIKPRHTKAIVMTLAFILVFFSAAASYGSSDLIVGINNSDKPLIKGVASLYDISDVVSTPSEVTVFVAGNPVGQVHIMLAVAGPGLSSPTVDNQLSQQIQDTSAPALIEGSNSPYYLWELSQKSDKTSDWQFAFYYNKTEYYARTVRLNGVLDGTRVRAFIDNDNNYYYSYGDVASGFDEQLNISPHDGSQAAFQMLINDDGELILRKACDQESEEDGVITATAPYLLVDGVQIAPIADDHHDLLITLCDGIQTWTLLKEYTPWLDVNILGYYTDPGRGNERTTIFEGPRNEGYTFETNMTDEEPIGLWFLNDINNDTIYNGNDSWLFSERFLTRSSFANEHQWFMVYDVSGYKGMGSTYDFYCPTEDYSTTGDYDFLVYIDDDHTSANWDHNDMIFGISCSAAPDSCGNFEPGVPPNYFMVDTSYFIGAPALPIPPPDSGGVYVYLDTTNYHWTIACHIYSQGNSMEQFHGNIVTIMDEPPQVGVNIFFDNFELWEDTTNNICLFQNDRWGWSLWDSTLGLYEIWWDVATREYQQGEGDLNDFLTIELIGTALDFNVWSSGHELEFDEFQIYLGAAMTPLGSIPGYYDYGGYEVVDRYQQEVGSDPANDPNTSVFSRHCGAGESYNAYGLIQDTDSYYCDSEYGLTYGGPFVYQADGLQFSTWGVGDLCLNNLPPVCDLVDDASYFVCDDTTFSFYISADDPDENLIGCTMLSGPGLYENEYWTFTTSGPGVYSATFECEDYCGETCTGTVNITVNYNSPPVVTCPGDTTLFVCDDSQICIPGFTYFDADGNVDSLAVYGCELFGDTVCFYPEGSSKTILFIAFDECGALDSCHMVVDIIYNSPPVATCPDDIVMGVCDLSEICIDGFIAADPDNNISSVVVDNGVLNGSEVCFTPVEGLNTITFTVTDSCGEVAQCVTNVTVNLNSPPTATCPDNTTLFVCDLSDICIDGFIASDPDNNISSAVVDNGTLTGTEVCFTPIEGLNTITFTVTDECGEIDECVTEVTVTLNRPPVADCPANSALLVCDLSPICIDGFIASDPDNNITSVVVDNGTLNGTEVCFTPVEGLNTITMTVTDACGATDQCVTEVTVTLNSPPVADCPDDVVMTVCDLSPICIDGFIYSDVDDNIVDVSVSTGTLNGSEVCFTPVEGLNTITLTVTDECGEIAQCVTYVTVTLNSPPVVNCPDDVAMTVCDLSNICIDGFTYSDPDNNITDVTVTGGILNGSQVCFDPVEGLNAITLTVTDACGAIGECVTNVTVTLNSPPVVDCPDDVAMTVCDLSNICIDGFTYSDPDNNIADVTVTGGEWAKGTICFTPIEGVNTITLTVTDECGLVSECQTNVTVTLNSPPVVSCPDDVAMTVCDLNTICIDGFSYSDPDNNIVDVSVSTGSLNGSEVCFTPVAGINTITLTVTDACGEIAECATNVTITLNSPPVVDCPDDVAMNVCDLSDICIDGFTYSDVDGNITDVSVSLGILNGSEVCFTPVAGLNTITLTVTDACGEIAQCVTNVTVTLNSPPVVNCPDDVALTVCDLSEICIDGFNYSDPDNNIADVTVTGGYLNGSEVCFAPVEGDNTICLEVTDDCGASASCCVTITITLNSPPVVSCPDDVAMAVCDLSQICLDGFTYSDPDDNITDVTVTGGEWARGTICFTPVVGLNTITLTVTDACGLVSECETDITITLNSAPVATCPPDADMLVCDLSDICLDGFAFSDIDDNIADIVITGGYLDGDQVCFTPTEGLNTIGATVTDDCGATDYCETEIMITLNSPPTVECPDDVAMTVCDLGEICIDGFTYSDVDDNITDVTVTGGTLIGTEVCFTPVEGLNVITLTVTDDCGEIAYCVTNVTVTLNSSPIVNCPANMTMTVCELNEICVDGFSYSDPDDNIADVEVTGGTLNGSQVCFTPVVGVNTICIQVTDDCGATASCCVDIIITLNAPPEVSCPGDSAFQVGDLSEICIPGFSYSDPDDNIETVEANIGEIRGDSICFVPVEGLNTICLIVTDECGVKDSCCTVLDIVMNTCPIITRPADTTFICTYENFCDTVEVFDDDGDYINMSTTYGEMIPIVDEPGHWLGLYCFHVYDYDCGLHNNYQVTVQADDGLCIDDITVAYDVTVLGYVDMFLDEDVLVMPGTVGRVGLYLNTYDCMCVGGLNASLAWDPSIITLVNIFPTENLDFGNEYHNININAFGPGSVKLSYIADLNNQIPHGPLCDIDPNEPIFFMDFQLGPGPYPIDFVVPICFISEESINDNAVADSSGYHVWWADGCGDQPDSSQFGTLLLNLECGSIRVIDECDVVIGDINLNRTPFEIGDAVLLANHLMDPDLFPFTLMQYWASDINGDSIRASIADLILLINIINGFGPTAKVAPPDLPVELVIAKNNDGETSLRLESDYDIGGLILELPLGTDIEAGLTLNPDLGMDVEIRESAERLRLMIYSPASNKIMAGSTELLSLDLPAGMTIDPTEISVSDAWGNLATALVTHERPLPEQFGIANCYPNPFNANTKVEFTLPEPDRISLSIYDVTGRLVKELVSGDFEAGYHQATWLGQNDAGRRVSSGLYFVKLKSQNDNLAISIEKLVLLK